MILLDLSNPFEFTLRDQDGNETQIKGTFREYTKKEQQEAKDKYEKLIATAEKVNLIARKITRNEKLIEVKEKLEDYQSMDKLLTDTNKLEDELIKINKTVNVDEAGDGLKDRFALCLGGEQKDEIIDLAETVGYQKVYEKIAEGVIKGKQED